MKKIDEQLNGESCLNKAKQWEMLFVLMARDPAAPVAIRAWIAERVRIGRNAPTDSKIMAAEQCAEMMEQQFQELKEKGIAK